MSARTASFAPDYGSVPGDSLRETLDELQMTQADLAARLGLSTKHINQIIQGVAAITPETSLAFERVTGVPASFWTNLESQYQIARARETEAAEAELEREWVQAFPLKELQERGVIHDRRDYLSCRQELLSFFGVATRQAWERLWMAPEASFRRSRAYRVDDYATACWLRLGELQAQRIQTAPFEPTRFRQALTRTRRSMTSDDFVEVMRGACADAGVAVVLLQQIKNIRAHGAVRWLTPHKAVLQLTDRGRREDQFWFSFFHEAGHILLHGKRDPFIEVDAPDAEEEEANRFARQMLIPDEDAGRLAGLQSDAAISAFAKELGLPPGVVVGRLQHDSGDFTRWNHLRRSIRIVEA